MMLSMCLIPLNYLQTDELDETSGVPVMFDEDDDEGKGDVIQELKEEETDDEIGEEVTYEETLKTADGVTGNEVIFSI